jgi:hypothetical protein
MLLDRVAEAAPSGRSGARRAIPRPTIVEATLLAAVAVWSAVAIARFAGAIASPASSRAFDGLLAGPPLALGLVWLLRGRPSSSAVRLATGWSAVLAAILLLTPSAAVSPTLALGLPAVLLLAWLLTLRPAIGAVALVAITGSFGSLSIYLHVPYKRVFTLLFAALWLAAIARFYLRRRTEPSYFPTGVLLVAAYLVICAVQVVLAPYPGVALGGFELAPLYMTPVLLVAYSQWSRETQIRIVKWILVIAVLVGGYATLRQVIGPSAAEHAEASLSAYNFVGTKQKLIGSFISGPDLAEWTALMIPFCLAGALGFRGRTRIAACVALPLLTVGLFGSQVRAAAVAVVLGALVTVLVHGRARAFPGLRLGQSAVVIGVIASIVLGGYAFAGASGQNSGHSYLSLLTASSNDVSVTQHQYKWNVALKDLTGHPFGYGLGTAPAGYTSNAPSSPFVLPVTHFSVDNGFLKVALEQGFTVMVLFALIFIALVVALLRWGLVAADPFRATIAVGAAGSAVCFFVLEGAGAFADGVPAIAGWIVIGLGLAQVAQIRAERGGRTPA